MVMNTSQRVENLFTLKLAESSPLFLHHCMTPIDVWSHMAVHRVQSNFTRTWSIYWMRKTYCASATHVSTTSQHQFFLNFGHENPNTVLPFTVSEMPNIFLHSCASNKLQYQQCLLPNLLAISCPKNSWL